MKHLDPKAVKLFFLQNLMVVILLMPFWMALFILLFYKEGRPLFLPAIFYLLLSFLIPALLVYWWAKLTFNNYLYELKESEFRKERGVIFKKYTSIPYNRVQNVDITRGILDRMLGLSTLVIQTAGYSGVIYSEGRLPGLDIKEAEKLRELLLGKVK